MNRTSTDAWSRYGTLTNLSYSTGLTTSLDYELRDTYNYPGQAIGGLRVRRIITQDAVSQLRTIREYACTDPGTTTSSGFLPIKPVYRFDVRDASENPVSAVQKPDMLQKTPGDSAKAALPRYVYNSYLYGQMLARSGKPVVGYRSVEETLYSGRIDPVQFLANSTYRDTYRLGTTRYTFNQNEVEYAACSSDGVQNDGISYYPWRYRPDFDYLAGLPSGIVELGKAGQNRSFRSFDYSSALTGLYGGRHIVRYNSLVSSTYNQAAYTNYFRRIGLSIELSRQYDQAGTNYTQSTTNYYYKDEMDSQQSGYTTTYPGKHNQVCLIKTTDARGRAVEVWNLYAGDFDFGTTQVPESQPCYNEVSATYTPDCYTALVDTELIPTDSEARAIYDMRKKNIRGPVIETYTKRADLTRPGAVISAGYQSYKKEGADAGTAKAGEAYQSFRLDTSPLASFTSARWNGSQVAKDGNYLLAGTVNQYNPIGLPTSVSANFGTETQTTYGYNNRLPVSSQTAVGLPEARTGTAQYAVPMFGASQQTSPNGQVTTYQYEPATGRLQTVRDTNGAVRTQYDYKRKDQ